MNNKDNYAKHRREQVLRWANTTAEQRLQFVEDALEFTYSAGINYQETKRLISQKKIKGIKTRISEI